MVELKPAIIRRKSIREYKAEPFSLEETNSVKAIINGAPPLFKDIKTEIILLPGGEYHKITGGLFIVQAPYYIIIKSELKEGYLVNAGYLGENIVLGLTEAGIGSCWLGGAKSREKAEDKLPYVISIALGKPVEAFRENEAGASRKPLPDIASGDIAAHESALAAARLAPSAMNRQPARYKCAADKIEVYKKKPLLPHLTKMQEIDCGIAIANITYNCPGYTFEKTEGKDAWPGCIYIGTLRKQAVSGTY